MSKATVQTDFANTIGIGQESKKLAVSDQLYGRYEVVDNTNKHVPKGFTYVPVKHMKPLGLQPIPKLKTCKYVGYNPPKSLIYNENDGYVASGGDQAVYIFPKKD